MLEFNRLFDHRLAWVPWQRPGFALALTLQRVVQENPGCDGIVLGGHGLFTWGDTQRDCYQNTISIIDQLGQLVTDHIEKKGAGLFGGAQHEELTRRSEFATGILPFLRGRVSTTRRSIGSFSDSPDVLRFVNSREAEALAHLGTSCPDHFIRTKIRPLFVRWVPTSTSKELRDQVDSSLQRYREECGEYYRRFALADSPAMRDANPTVVLIPGVGMFSFEKSKTEARLAGEFYQNAIHVMEGATSLAAGAPPAELPQAGVAPTSSFSVYSNYVALPASEAFRIEYWKLEEAKIRRQPPEKEFSRKIVVVVGGGNGIGRETALLAAKRGAHVVVADRDSESASEVAKEAKAFAGSEGSMGVVMDIRRRDAIRQSLGDVIMAYGGLDILINTAAIFPSSEDGQISDESWGPTLDLNVTANYLLADEAGSILRDQNLDAAIVFTSSANAVVPKHGSEAYDVSKAALSHLVRELAVSLAPKIRVNGISPATVVKGSSMFPRQRVVTSLRKYGIPFEVSSTDEELRSLLANFYAKRGGSRNALLNRLTARATGLEVVRGSSESTTVGNFAIQLAALSGEYADGVGVSATGVAKMG
jgi:rhamnulose-1-phosphate aldolase/alcohol dehydrogenase